MSKETKRALLPCTKRIPVMVPERLNAAVSIAAAQKYTTVSDYVRQSLISALRKDRVPIEKPAA
jgi:hypothetical protein